MKERFRAVIQTLKSMSWKERIVHIFTYYKWIFVAFLCLIIVISISINAISRYLNPPLYRGAVVGALYTEQTEAYLTTQLQEALDGKDTDREAVLRQISFLPLDDPNGVSTNQAAYYQLTTLVSGQELEYVIMDEHAWSLLKDGYFFADLEALLDAEALAQLKPLLQWVSDTETGKENALAIDITDSDFAKTYLRSQGKLYLAFPGNTDNLSYTRPFLQYLGLCEK